MRAHVSETLVRSDAITILMIHDETHRKHIAIGMPGADGVLNCVSAPTHPEILAKIRAGRADLRDAFVTSRERYAFELIGESVILYPTSDDAMLPAAGFRCSEYGNLVEGGHGSGRRRARPEITPLGVFLRELRTQRNHSIKEMAERIRTPDNKPIFPTFISMIESGARFAPAYFVDALIEGYRLGKRESEALRHAADATPQRHVLMPKGKLASLVAAQFTRQLDSLSEKELAAIQTILNRSSRSIGQALRSDA